MKNNVKKIIMFMMIVFVVSGLKQYSVQAEVTGAVSLSSANNYEVVSIPHNNGKTGTFTIQVHLQERGRLSISSGTWMILDNPRGTLEVLNSSLHLENNDTNVGTTILSGMFYLEAGDYSLILTGKPTETYYYGKSTSVRMDFTPVSDCHTSGIPQKLKINAEKNVKHFYDDSVHNDSFQFKTKAGHEYKVTINNFASTEKEESTTGSYYVDNKLTVGSSKQSGDFDFKKANFKFATSKNETIDFWIYFSRQLGDVSYSIKVTDITGIRKGTDGNLYYFKNNALATSKNGVVPSGTNLYYVEKGCVKQNFTGLKKYKKNQYYFIKGVCDKKYTGVIDNNGLKLYVKNSRLSNTYTGTAKYKNTVLYFTRGSLDKSKSGIFKYGKRKIYIKHGKWCRKTLIVTYKNEKYYVVDGVWNSDYMGIVTINGKKYTVKYGKVL